MPSVLSAADRVSAPAAFAAAAGDQPVIITRYVVDFCYVLRARDRASVVSAAVQRSSVVNLPKKNNRMTTTAAAAAAINALLTLLSSDS